MIGPLMERAEPDRIVCVCLQVTERQLREAVERSGVQTVCELIRATEAGTGCTACHHQLEGCLTRWSSPAPPLPEPAAESYAGPPA